MYTQSEQREKPGAMEKPRHRSEERRKDRQRSASLEQRQNIQVTASPMQSNTIPTIATPTHQSASQGMEVCEEHKRKRQFVDQDGFTHPSKTGKVTEEPKLPSIPLRNIYQILGGALASSSVSSVSQSAAVAPKPKRIPPINVKMKLVTMQALDSIKKAAAGPVSFEYQRYGLRIKTNTITDHKNIIDLLKREGVEYYTFNPNPGQIVKFVMRGLPPTVGAEEVLSGLNSAGAQVSHVRQIKRNILNETNTKVTVPLPMWVVSVPRSEEATQKLKNVRGLFEFTVKFEDFKARSSTLQCFRCQSFGHKAEFCNLKEQCVKCAGLHNTRDCLKTRDLPAKCVNCEGEHPANYRGCPIAQKFQKARSGATRTPVNSAPQQAPRINSRKEFPSLPRTSAVPPPITPAVSVPESTGDLKDILQMVTSGSLTKYIRKFKALMTEVMKQKDKASKLFTLGIGILELLDGQED